MTSSSFDPNAEIISFGKFKGRTWSSIPTDYLIWLASSGISAVKRRAQMTIEARKSSAGRGTSGSSQVGIVSPGGSGGVSGRVFSGVCPPGPEAGSIGLTNGAGSAMSGQPGGPSSEDRDKRDERSLELAFALFRNLMRARTPGDLDSITRLAVDHLFAKDLSPGDSQFIHWMIEWMKKYQIWRGSLSQDEVSK